MKAHFKTLLVVTFAVLFALVSIQPVIAGSSASDKAKTATDKAAKVVKAQKVNINTADEGTLANLKGVGPELAKRIVDYRSKSGKFKTITDLQNVNGIGEKTFAQIAPMITVK